MGRRPDGAPPDIPEIVRRDLTVAGLGVAGAVVCLAALAAAALGVVDDRPAATLTFVIALAVAGGCLLRWALGPDELRRERTIVVVPAFLVAAPALWALHVLGGGATVAIASGAVGFTAAAVLGVAWSSRRR